MDIRFISSLTPEDESQLAKALVGAVAKLLEPFSIAYTIRIETATCEVFDHHHAPLAPPVSAPPGGASGMAASVGPAAPSLKFESA